LREEYRIPRITKEKADSFEDLAGRLEGVDAHRFLETIRAFNAAPRPEVPFNPNIRDGLATVGLPIDKTNWAQRLDAPPYEAYAVTTGITFTFGGLKITNDAQVEDTTGHPIPGLYAAGEIVGGLYYHNYASGTGLMAAPSLAASLAAVPPPLRRAHDRPHALDGLATPDVGPRRGARCDLLAAGFGPREDRRVGVDRAADPAFGREVAGGRARHLAGL